ncbi:MAG: RagB/SusD family nutrient uptake outer membrane protein [Prevotellaceae bacterium]|jgi:hypothetical protein|nr:RagB/SusD family nutrient uptake outer membrane protein [Prevotellaceae bacterium]
MKNNIIRKIFHLGMITGMFFLSAGIFSSCNDYLNIDKYFSNELKLDSVFSQKRYVEAYMWGAATMFPDEGQLFSGTYTPGPLATDEAFTLLASAGYSGMAFALGEITPSSMGTLNIWDNMYKIIRKCNTIFARIDETQDITSSERLRILAYTRFIRAYAYYNLMMNFGPPIIVGEELLENNEPMEYYDRARATYDEAVEYICAELEQAALFIPAKLPIMNFGQPTKGAAYGLIARLRLIHASPLFNGGTAAHTYFGSWIRKIDGEYFVTQNYDEKRWAIAAAAAKRVMEMTEAGIQLYRLHTVDADSDTPTLPVNVTSDPDYYNNYPNGAAGIDPFRSYSEMFTGEAVIVTNPEYVWARNSSNVVSATAISFPSANGGSNGLSLTQKVVDAYRMVDGRQIDDSSPDYPYSETGFSSGTGLKNFSGYNFTASAEVFNMYVRREARFYASVGFSECLWPLESNQSTGQMNVTVNYYYGMPNGKGGSTTNPLYIPPTGYVVKKYIHPVDSWTALGTARRMGKAFPIIRYAEILLSYAEALNKLTGSHEVVVDEESRTFARNTTEIKNAFNLIRYRAGLPGLSAEELGDPLKVQAAIEQERMVEFLHENRRYFDVRRWGKYEDTENEPIMGMNIDATKEGFYQRVIPNTARIGSRVVNKRMVFVPIPKSELRRMPSLDQNPGWENY